MGTPWTLSDPPGKTVLAARNLLGNVLKDLFGKRFKDIDPGSEQDIDALNQAFERIHARTWVGVFCWQPTSMISPRPASRLGRTVTGGR